MNKELEFDITDPLTGTVYTVCLDEEEYTKARDDITFAKSLLNGLLKEQEQDDMTHEADDDDATGTEENLIENQAGPSRQSHPFNEEKCTIGASSGHNIHMWLHSETLALIKSMESHAETLSHPKKRKYVFENCANDLLSSGYSITATQCQNKWKSLVRSYTTSKDHKTKTGRGPSRFQFFDEMDAILGTKPSNHCEHAIESSAEVQNETLESKDDKENAAYNESDLDSDSKQLKNDNTKEVVEERVKKRKRTNYEEYLNEKKKIEAQKNKRHAEKMEIERQKIENDKEKIALLKEFLKRK